MNSTILAAIITAIVTILSALITNYKDEISRFFKTIFKIPLIKTRSRFKKVLKKTLIKLFKALRDQDENDFIINIGPQINEYLWHNGFYGILEKMGRIIEKAAVEEFRLDIQARMLIEHIGWILACKGQIEEAKDKINEGMAAAKINNDLPMQIKGLRHLAAIYYFYEKDKRKALKTFKDAFKLTNCIEDTNKKNESIAPLYYGMSKIYIDDGKFKEARKYNKEAEKCYALIGNKKRGVKIFNQKGEIEEKEGNKQKAIIYYKQGLEYARKYGRKDDIIKNLLGLSRVVSDDREKAEYKKEAETLEKDVPLLFH